jgi:MarR family transcriptional regulator, transcriptional regulator for hemolysin
MDPLRNFGFLLKDLSRLHSLNFERHATDLNLTLAQCKVLCYLQRNEGISQVRLAAITDTDPMTLMRILDRMEDDGLVARKPDPDDRRARRVFLQASAAPVLQKIWRLSDCSRTETLAGLSAVERTQLLSLMQRVHSNLAALIPGAADVSGLVPRSPRKRARALDEAARS